MWALDLGTTNTLLARWDAEQEKPSVLELTALARKPGREDPLEAPRVVPTAVHILEHPTAWARFGKRGLLARNFFLGQLALIGRLALERNQAQQRPGFVPTFKRELSRQPLLTLARAGGRAYTARDVARLFMRELLAATHEQTGARIRELTITVPVDAYETYRAELAQIGNALGIRKLRFLDEPVAAALGYGLGISSARRVLVVDFGGGTMHIALVKLGVDAVQRGTSEVLAKGSRDLGGNLVDRWLLEEFCKRLDYELGAVDEDEEQRLWQRLMLAEACRVKEALHFSDRATFDITPPEGLRRFEARLRGEASTLEIGRDDLVRVLRERGLYREVEASLAEVLERGGNEVDEVLMVGGSTLLPDVYALFESRFGRNRVRAWHPFEAVAYGACVFAANRVTPADHVVHDYALLTYSGDRPEHTVVVPAGTHFPTATDLWKRQLVPTCALGEPERIFKLVICEIGSADGGRTFAWDGAGNLHKLGGADGENRLVVKLNEANPALGHLDPPHSPSDKRPRLEVSFGVNGERWLCATVVDLKTHKRLMQNEPVVRLL